MSRQPEPPAWLVDAVDDALMRYLGTVGGSNRHVTATIWSALLAEGFHVWRRCPTCVLQTEQMMGYGDRAEHFWAIPLPVVEPRDTEHDSTEARLGWGDWNRPETEHA